MKYFKQPDGVIRALDLDGSQDFLIHPEWIAMSESDAMGHLMRPAESLVPHSVTKRQARAALIIRGHAIGRDYIAEVESYLDSIEGIEGVLARDEWGSSSAVERYRPLAIQMAQLLGLTEEDTDELFIFAATL